MTGLGKPGNHRAIATETQDSVDSISPISRIRPPLLPIGNWMRSPAIGLIQQVQIL